jgi:DNA-binding CsgD family transcriptional regulator
MCEKKMSEISTLTKRECEICAMLVNRMSPAQISGALTIEKRTVYCHMANIAKKLNLPSRKTSVMRRSLSRQGMPSRNSYFY